MQVRSQFCSHPLAVCMHFIPYEQEFWQAHAAVLILVFLHHRVLLIQQIHSWESDGIKQLSGLYLSFCAEADDIGDHRHWTLTAPFFSFLLIQPSCCPSRMPSWTNSHISRFAWKLNPARLWNTTSNSDGELSAIWSPGLG